MHHAGLEQMGIEQVYEFKTNDLLNRVAKNATTNPDVLSVLPRTQQQIQKLIRAS